MLSTSHLRELAQAAARVFGWDQQQCSGDTHNTLVITSEQLDQIREARQASLKPGDIGYVAQPDKERRALLTEAENESEP